MESLKLPYNPLIYLRESYVAQYKIYVLRHPETKAVFYVGQTISDLQTRLSGHLSQKESNIPKINLIQQIIDETGEKPIIEEIETIHGTCYLDRIAINEREIYWIKYYKSIGCKLVNSSSMGDSAKCKEYHNYLSSIKKGETSWHYYYCGKTASGYEVYDEKKLSADGFKFPDPPKVALTMEEDEGYNPWKNERFIAKNGYRRSYDDKYSYVPCYKDTDPNIYDDDY